MKAVKFISFALLVTLSTAALAPGAIADSRQSNKNTWRNLAIGSGAVALYGLQNHDTTTTLLGAAGAAYSANRYEQDRHSQDQSQRARMRFHRRAHHYYRGRRHHSRYSRR
jgi:hypothetical protein